MIFFWFSQMGWAESICDSRDPDQQHTVSVLQEYFAVKDCNAVVDKLAKVTSISLVNKDLKDISIFRFAKRLKYLNLSGNQIADTSELSTATDLKWLDLSGNPIGTMNNLPIQSLQTFWCVDCGITSLETSEQMSQLKHLSLRNNHLEVIDVTQFPQLEALLLSENRIVDPSNLAHNKKIKVVELYGNPIDRDKCPKDKKIARGLRRACYSLFEGDM